MQYRPLGKTGFRVSQIGFGGWAIGGGWGGQAELNLAASDKPDLPQPLLVKLRRHNWLRGVWYSGK